MSLVRRASELQDGLRDLKSRRKAAERDAWFRDRALDLRNAREGLEGPLGYLAAVDELRPPVPRDGSLTEKLAAAREASKELLEAATNDPGAVASGTLVQKVRQRLLASSSSASAVASMHWRQMSGELTPAVKGEVLYVLEQIPAYRGTVGRMRDLYRESSQLAAKTWPTRLELARLIQMKSEADAAWEGLAGGEGIPADMMSFLVACAHGGAELDALTPSIREWIANRRLADSFRVRFSGG
jgi:hypothetical protein